MQINTVFYYGDYSCRPFVLSSSCYTVICTYNLLYVKSCYTGDRYWYENGNTPGSFTIKQLEEIRKSTMAQILCYNGDRLQWMQPRAFILKDPFL